MQQPDATDVAQLAGDTDHAAAPRIIASSSSPIARKTKSSSPIPTETPIGRGYEPLRTCFKHRGATVWFDEIEVHAGEPLREAIEKGLRNSDIVVFARYAGQRHTAIVFFEIGAAVSMGKRWWRSFEMASTRGCCPILSAAEDSSSANRRTRRRKSFCQRLQQNAKAAP